MFRDLLALEDEIGRDTEHGSVYEATDVMREAIALHVERDYHVKDILRGPDEAPGKGRPVSQRQSLLVCRSLLLLRMW